MSELQLGICLGSAYVFALKREWGNMFFVPGASALAFVLIDHVFPTFLR